MECQPKRKILKLNGRPLFTEGYTPEKNGTQPKALETEELYAKWGIEPVG
jgi:hypothetical protein